MGLSNKRAICPQCGVKIHTQARGAGHLMLGAKGALVQTGTECQWCGVALSGKVGMDGRAILAEVDEARQQAKAEKAAVKQAGRDEVDERLIELLRGGPLTTREAAKRLGVPHLQIATIQTRVGDRVKASGFGKNRTLSLRDH